MKHSIKITLFLVGLFLVTQLFGLTTVNKYIQPKETISPTGNITIEIEHPVTVLGEPPRVENKSSSYIYIMLGVLLGTGLLFLFIKFNIQKIWKYWFLLSVFVTLAVAFGVYMNPYLAVGAAVALGWWKVYRPNVWVHNLTEIFIYTGIAIIFISILNLLSAFILLLLISVYDMIAVWKSKHMITLAKFQTEAKVFAGLFIPYKRMGRKKGEEKIILPKKVLVKPTRAAHTMPLPPSEKMKNAILGGGDIAFPLLFASAAMERLIEVNHLGKAAALGFSGIIAITSAIALLILLLKAREDTFYPAMPFITVGCFAGYWIVWLLL
ncbi:hypothetical protein HY488_01070 [Candidatus Woesearchaeota archaeon]|nr:hypothetical protein [Candidatus Woesearchaeota archaeon]